MASEEIEKALSTGEAKKGEGNPDLQAQLEKAQHSAEVWAGRAKTQGEELKRLREENAKLKASKSIDATVSAIPTEVKGDTPDDYLKPAIAGAKQLVDEATASLREENQKLRDDIEKREERIFAEQLGLRHPKFFDQVTPGKDKEKAWEQFKELNKETYEAVMKSRDASRFDSLIDSFYCTIGVPNPERSGASATPSQSNAGGVQQVQTQTKKDTMTTTEFMELRRKAEEFRKAGDMKSWREIDTQLREALNAGRVQ